MTRIERSAIVACAPEAMYRLVNDVERYPEFLPWCRRVELHEREPSRLRATLHVGKGRLEHGFTTENRMREFEWIEIGLVDGPFRHLHGRWEFEPFGDVGCQVRLAMRFEFTSRLLEMSFGRMFREISESLVAAFCARAERLHGA